MYEPITLEPWTPRISRKEVLARVFVGMGIGALFIAGGGAIVLLILLSSAFAVDANNFSAVDSTLLILGFGVVPVVGIGIGLILVGSHLFRAEAKTKTKQLEQSAAPEQPASLEPDKNDASP